MQDNYSDCSRVVLRSSDHVQLYPTVPAQPAHSTIQTPHRNLSKLNLHEWLLEPQQSRSRTSLKQWQHELRLLKKDQPDQSMRQFLQNGASVIKWTSGHPV